MPNRGRPITKADIRRKLHELQGKVADEIEEEAVGGFEDAEEHPGPLATVIALAPEVAVRAAVGAWVFAIGAACVYKVGVRIGRRGGVQVEVERVA